MILEFLRTIYHLATYHDITKYHDINNYKYYEVIFHYMYVHVNHTSRVGQYQNTEFMLYYYITLHGIYTSITIVTIPRIIETINYTLIFFKYIKVYLLNM